MFVGLDTQQMQIAGVFAVSAACLVVDLIWNGPRGRR